jgi:hypothetical protein
MKLYEKVAQEIVKDISGEYEKFYDIEPLELFLRDLEEMEDPRVTEELVAMLPDTELNKLCSQINTMKQEGSNSEKQVARVLERWAKGQRKTIREICWDALEEFVNNSPRFLYKKDRSPVPYYKDRRNND